MPTSLPHSWISFDYWLSWSPDGSRLAFISSDIFVVDYGGSDLRNLTNSSGSYDYVSWSPDGSRLAYTFYANDHENIYIMNADGSDPHLLVQDGWEPTWSPDGLRIAFVKPADETYNFRWNLFT